MSENESSAPERTDSRFSSVKQLTEGHIELRTRFELEPDSEGILEEIQSFVRRGSATGTLLDDDAARDVCQSLLDYWVTTLYRNDIEIDGKLADYDFDLSPNLEADEYPYVGLRAYSEDDERDLFGHGEIVSRLIATLDKKSIVSVVGRAGSGKSSLVSAGLIPNLKRNKIPGSEEWSYGRLVVTGDHPGKELDAVANPSIAEDAGEAGTMLVFIDQFEELFSEGYTDDERQAYCEELKALVDRGDRVVLAMRSEHLKDQFHPFLRKHPQLQSLFKDSMESAMPLRSEDLRKAIEAPAAMVSLRFEKRVVSSLVRDVIGESAGLPLMQFALMKLWERKNRNLITLHAYNQLGGVISALEATADQCYEQELGNADDQAAAKQIFLKLVPPSVTSGFELARVQEQDLYRGATDRKRIEAVLEKLVATGLVRRTERREDAPPQYDILHEALARQWQPLRDWIDEARHSQRQWIKLNDAAKEWMENDKDDAFLYRGDKWIEIEAEVSKFGDELEENEAQTKFLNSCRALREKEKRRERQKKLALVAWSAAVTVLAVLAIVGWVVAEDQRAEAKRQEAEAIKQKNTAERLKDLLVGRTWLESAEEAYAGVSPPDQFSSALLAARAINFDGYTPDQQRRNLNLGLKNPFAPALDDDPRAAEYLARADEFIQRGSVFPLWQSPRTRHHRSRIKAVAISPGGETLASADQDGSIRLWNAETQSGKLLHVLAGNSRSSGGVLCLAFNSNGTLLASGGNDKLVKLWDVNTGEALGTLSGHVEPVTCVAFKSREPKSSDAAEVLASGSEIGIVKLWEVRSESRVALDTLFIANGPVIKVAFGSDGKRLIVGGTVKKTKKGVVQRWNLEVKPLDRIDTDEEEHDSLITNLAVFPSPAGDIVAIGDTDGEVSKVSIQKLGEGGLKKDGWIERVTHKGRMTGLVFSANGEQIASSWEDGMIRMANVDDASEPSEITTTHQGSVTGLAFVDPAGDRIISAGADGTIKQWDVNKREAFGGIAGTQPAAAGVAIHPDGKHIAASGFDGKIRIFNRESGKEFSSAAAHEGDVTSLTLNSDGSILASGDDQGKISFWKWPTDGPDEGGTQNLAPQASKASHEHGISQLQFHGSALISTDEEGGMKIWSDPIASELVVSPPNETSCIVLIPERKNPARNLAAVGTPDGTVHLLNAESGKTISKFKAHSAEVTAISFRRVHKVLATGCIDGSIALWPVEGKKLEDFKVGKKLVELTSLQGAIRDIAFSPDGKMLASSGVDRTVKIWELQTKGVRSEGKSRLDATVTPFATLSGYATPVSHVSFVPPHGKTLVSICDDGALKHWNVKPIGLDHSFHYAEHTTMGVAFGTAEESDSLFIAANDGIQTRDIGSGLRKVPIEVRRVLFYQVAVSPDGKLIASAGDDGTVRLWNSSSGDRVGKIPPDGEPDRRFFSVAFAHTNEKSILASGGDDGDGKILLWDVTDPKDPKVLPAPSGHDARVTDLMFSPDDRFLLSSSRDGSVQIWDQKEQKGQKFNVPGNSVAYSITWSGDGRSFAAGDAAGNISIWDRSKNSPLRSWHARMDEVRSLRFHPNPVGGREVLAAGGSNGTVKLWDSKSGKALRTMSGHSDLVFSIAFSPDGKHLASSSLDRKVNVWLCEKMLLRPNHADYIPGWLTLDPELRDIVWEHTTDNLYQPKAVRVVRPE